jgi:hypothetical protein
MWWYARHCGQADLLSQSFTAPDCISWDRRSDLEGTADRQPRQASGDWPNLGFSRGRPPRRLRGSRGQTRGYGPSQIIKTRLMVGSTTVLSMRPFRSWPSFTSRQLDAGKRKPTFPPPHHPGYTRGMSPNERMISIAIAGVSVIVGAFSIWLTVRIINRRERWAIRTAMAMLAIAAIGAVLALLYFFTEIPP